MLDALEELDFVTGYTVPNSPEFGAVATAFHTNDHVSPMKASPAAALVGMSNSHTFKTFSLDRQARVVPTGTISSHGNNNHNHHSYKQLSTKSGNSETLGFSLLDAPTGFKFANEFGPEYSVFDDMGDEENDDIILGNNVQQNTSALTDRSRYSLSSSKRRMSNVLMHQTSLPLFFEEIGGDHIWESSNNHVSTTMITTTTTSTSNNNNNHNPPPPSQSIMPTGNVTTTTSAFLKQPKRVRRSLSDPNCIEKNEKKKKRDMYSTSTTTMMMMMMPKTTTTTTTTQNHGINHGIYELASQASSTSLSTTTTDASMTSSPSSSNEDIDIGLTSIFTLSDTPTKQLVKQVQEKPKHTRRSSNYRGVSRCIRDGRWQARIRVGKTVKYLGRFKHEKDAALCYDRAARDLNEEKLHLNFPDEF